VTVTIIYVIDIVLPNDEEGTNFGKTFKARGLAYNSTIVVIGNTFVPFFLWNY